MKKVWVVFYNDSWDDSHIQLFESKTDAKKYISTLSSIFNSQFAYMKKYTVQGKMI